MNRVFQKLGNLGFGLEYVMDIELKTILKNHQKFVKRGMAQNCVQCFNPFIELKSIDTITPFQIHH